jgi:thiol-disulfide isomerase/thioredoxin
MKRLFAIVLCLALLAAAGCKLPGPHTEPEPTETQAPEPVVTDAPAEPAEPAEPQGGAFNTEMIFSGTTLDGEPIDQTIFENYDLIIVNCWAEWCGPCVGELPAIERIHQEYPNVLVLGLLVGTMSVDTAKQTLADSGVTYAALEPVGALEELSMRSMYIPATYFFDKNGNEVGDSVVGGMDYEQWKATVDNLLG